MQFNKGDRVAQLLSFPYIKGKAAPVEGPGGFGNTGKCVFWKTIVDDSDFEVSFQNTHLVSLSSKRIHIEMRYFQICRNQKVLQKINFLIGVLQSRSEALSHHGSW